jgi:nucleotidyltransferase/DNA polymerase involved in DNA repair
MDTKQVTEIIKRLELGEPLSKITRDKKLPDASTVYRYCREDEELQKKIMAARQTGVFTLLDKIAEDMEIPKTPQETHFLREKWSHIRWMASKLAAKRFGDKLQQDIKQDTTITVSWGKPNEMVDAKKIVEEIQTTAVPSLPNS